MFLIIKLAWRSLWRNKRRTLITVTSIGLGLTCAVFFISLAEGMYKKLTDDAVRMFAGHVTVEHPEYSDAPAVDRFVASVSAVERAAREIPGVERIKPMILGQAVVSTGSGSGGVGMVAVVPEAEIATSPLANKIVAGRYLKADDKRGVVLGARLAERLKLKPKKKLVLTTTNAQGKLVNELLRVTGIYEVGMEEADAFLIQIPLAVGRRVMGLGPDQATRVGVVLETPDLQTTALEHLTVALSGEPVVVRPWQEVLPDLAAYITVDRGSNYVFQGIILFLICFTILNTILMSVLERTREFATLMAIGTSSTVLRLQVVVESFFLGILGVAVGLGLGGWLGNYIETEGLDMSEMFPEGATVSGFAIDPLIRGDLTLDQMLWLGGLVFAATVIIGLYPAFKSSRFEIADVLRTR